MPKKIYLKQIRQKSNTQKFFDKGLTVASAVLLYLKDSGEGFLESLPSSYPGFKFLKGMFGVGCKKSNVNSTIRSSLFRLRKQGLISKEPKEGVYFLTEKGKEAATEIKSRYLISRQPWDGKLRIVVFDIPEKIKMWREAVRQELLMLHFCQLQKSVYIGKYPFPQDFYQELERHDVLKHVFLLTVSDIDRKEHILKLLEEGM